MGDQTLPQIAASSDGLTIDELAASSGVPSRTIRFYQAKGILPHPRKQGRVAYYDQHHVERLQLISELQDKGLRLRAIRDVLSRPEATTETIHEWLGVSDRVNQFNPDAPVIVSEQELRAALGEPKPGVIGRLLKSGQVERRADGSFLITSKALLDVAFALGQAGIDLDVAIGLREILEKRVARAADELVKYCIEHIGKGFGRSDDPKDVSEAVEALMPNAPGGDAVLLIFGREVSRALSERLEQGAELVGRRASQKRGRR